MPESSPMPCGFVWFLAVLIQSAFAYFVFYSRQTIDHPGYPAIHDQHASGSVCAAWRAAAFMPNVISWMFYRLTAFDMTSKAPPVLVYNCITFLMSPSLLALIPGGTKPWLALGPALAGVWMFVLLLITAIARLRIRVGAAIIGSVLTFLATSGMVIVGIFAIQFVWCIRDWRRVNDRPDPGKLQIAIVIGTLTKSFHVRATPAATPAAVGSSADIKPSPKKSAFGDDVHPFHARGRSEPGAGRYCRRGGSPRENDRRSPRRSPASSLLGGVMGQRPRRRGGARQNGLQRSHPRPGFGMRHGTVPAPPPPPSAPGSSWPTSNPPQCFSPGSIACPFEPPCSHRQLNWQIDRLTNDSI